MVKLYNLEGTKVIDTELDKEIKDKKYEKKKLQREIKKLNRAKFKELDKDILEKANTIIEEK